MKEIRFSVSHSSSRLWPGFSGTKFNVGCVTRYFIHSHVCGWVADEERSEGCQANACQWYCQEEGPSLLDFKRPKPKKDTPVQKLSILHCLFISFLRKTNYWKVYINTPGPAPLLPPCGCTSCGWFIRNAYFKSNTITISRAYCMWNGSSLS